MVGLRAMSTQTATAPTASNSLQAILAEIDAGVAALSIGDTRPGWRPSRAAPPGVVASAFSTRRADITEPSRRRLALVSLRRLAIRAISASELLSLPHPGVLVAALAALDAPAIDVLAGIECQRSEFEAQLLALIGGAR